MKKILIVLCLTGLAFLTNAQSIKGVTLQASGLTCSMCSKAVYKALLKVPFVQKVDVNIKDQQYSLSFKEGTTIDFDAIDKAVEDAGFSVAVFKVDAQLPEAILQKDQHMAIGNQQFHFLNANGQHLSGAVSFTIVDKKYTSAKEYNKYSKLSKLSCVQTGYSADCCKDMQHKTRIYHAII
jgi:copper chaperone CopZ